MQELGTALTGIFAGLDPAERNWSLYKSIANKTRGDLGKVRADAFKDEAVDFDETTGAKLAYGHQPSRDAI